MPWRANLDHAARPDRLRDNARKPRLSADEISDFCHSLAAARDQFSHAAKAVTERFGLGPRGPWIIGIVGRMEVSPHQLADFFSVGRSLITAELNKLSDAGLILQIRDERDGRRSTITLTDLGKAAFLQLGQDLEVFLTERLRGYTPEEIRLCARLLADFSHPEK